MAFNPSYDNVELTCADYNSERSWRLSYQPRCDWNKMQTLRRIVSFEPLRTCFAISKYKALVNLLSSHARVFQEDAWIIAQSQLILVSLDCLRAVLKHWHVKSRCIDLSLLSWRLQ